MIDLHEFETWLRGFPENEAIALARDCSNCPVAKFLIHQGHYDVMVSPGYVLIDENPHPLPDWAATLIEHVDTCGPKYVTAHQVLDVLSRVKSGELKRIGSNQ